MNAHDWAHVDAARADRAAFADLYRTHHDSVYGYVLSRVRHRELAEDLTGDVFVRAIGHLDRVQDTGHAFGAWLATIARNVVVDHHRRGTRRPETLVGDWHDVTVPAQRAATDRVDAALMLRGSLAALSGPDRDVLEQRYLHGRSFDEIAVTDGRSASAIRTQRQRALVRLRRNLRIEVAS